MRLIVTRPLEDAGTLADKLMALGHKAVIMPILTITARGQIEIPDRPYQAMCITSANAMRVLELDAKWMALTVYTVGPQSKAEAQRKGFTHVSAHGGDVNGLAHFINTHVKPEAGPLLYLSGSETSGDLEGKLKSHGFDVDRVVAYDAVPAEIDDFTQQIETADGVLLYSPRSAQLWSALVGTHKCQRASQLTHFCLSANIAAKLPKDWPRKIAATPTEGDMLALLDQRDDLA